MKTKQVISLILIFILAFAVPNTNYVQAKEKTSKVQITERQEKFDKAFRKQFNRYRTSMGLKKLKTENGLVKVARVRAKELSVSFSHTRPKNKSLIKLCDSKGVKKAHFYGEIIARVKYNKDNSFKGIAMATVQAWKCSKSHNKAMVDNRYKYVGTASFRYKNSIYICTVFAG